MGKYYALYVNKESFKIEIKLKKINGKRYGMEMYVDGDIVVRYNSCYYVCGSRKPLKEFALELKNIWIKEAEQNLVLMHSIKI